MSRDRDRILEQALQHELRAAGTPPAGACLDAETLGAWTDGGLDPAAMAAVEAHVSTCARCQAMAGTMVRTASILGTPGAPGTLGTMSLWKWWLAPLAAGVAAVTLWMVVPEQQKLATAPPQPEIATRAQTPAAVQSLPPAAPARDAAAAQATDQLARRDNKAASGARENRRQEKPTEDSKEEVAALQERAKLADAAAPAATAPPPAAPSPSATATLRAPAEFGALRKNAGKIVVPPGIEVTEQSAPSDSVCWFVGRAGLVLLTTDAGATFTRVDLAEPLDIASVSATDARIATITTVSGRRFRTEDGGRTWRPF